MIIRPNIMVSVCMITYGHEDYIKQAIEGVLMQECDFEVELLIADDCSPDCTQTIVEEIKRTHKNAHWIRYVKHQPNKGMIPNFVWALQECRGKYIALCEGDDYWTDVLKLQKQVGFMEGNSDFSAIASNSLIKYEGNNKASHNFKKNIKDTLVTNDFLEGRHFHTATYMFKKELFKSDFPTNILSGDRTLFLLISCFGKTKMIPEITAVYRKNEGGISNNVISEQMMRDFNLLPFIKKYSNNKISFDKLKAFIALTVISYSHSIEKKHFLQASLALILSNFKQQTNLKNGIKSVYKNLSIVKKYYYKVK
ncbi:putative glycosyltransferase (GT2) [Formosa agariphila KMM 3901]|uniref:Putative glycosyltransferase (GT2) n=1 Tax=Formosa agariphila (strain DSM 15362 / KCTC 12365 / LMG 23005 / KMM 3901 / M-2Alg 35-1) TaxID=1347342 RepID=T2KMB5_FORAG|nr:glycosyltransferase [Formosa agariphila]CDF80037.1 putative glycosyltransferase (GT2) [Formosa agariphila KMM 3901]